MWKELNEAGVYIVDTFPVAVCDNIRIGRCKIYQGEDYRGYKPSKKRCNYSAPLFVSPQSDKAKKLW